MGKVLVLGSDNRSFLSVVRSLGRRDLAVQVGWCPPDASALRSRYILKVHDIPSYSAGNDLWKRSLISLMQQERFDLVIPCDDPTVIPLQEHRLELERFGSVYLLHDEAFEVVFDKFKSYELAKSLGVPVPKGIVVSGPADAEAALAVFGLPVVIKPRATFGASDLVNRNFVRKAYTVEEWRAHLKSMASQGGALLQENFVGTGVGVELLADRGEVLFAFQHVRVHEPLVGGGSSYRKSVALNPDLAEAARKLMQALGYTGVAMVEFRVNFDTGRWVFVEINGRFWGSLPLALAAGADFPYYLYLLLVQKKRDFPQQYRVGVYCRNLWLDAVWMLENSSAGRSDRTLATLSPWQVAKELVNILTFRERSDTFVLDDPMPGFVEVLHILRVLRMRAIGKIQSLLISIPPIRKWHAARARRALSQARAILFVCKGNICRSPFAERYAKTRLAGSVRVSSCGYYPKEGRRCPETAVAAGKEMGIELASHRSRVVSEEIVRSVQTVFAFDEEDYRTILTRYPFARPKLHLLGLLGPHNAITIKDPYGKDLDAFRAVYRTIALALDSCARSSSPRSGQSC